MFRSNPQHTGEFENGGIVPTNTELWRFTTGNMVISSPAVLNGVVYIGSWDHKLYAIDAITGKEKWRFATGNLIFSSPAVADGVVYVGSDDKNLYAINAVTGKEKWRFTTGKVVFSSPTVVDGVVYVGSHDKNLYAIDAATGKEKWRFATGNLVRSSPAVANGILYVGSDDKNLYAIDAATGKEKWRFATENLVFSSPAVANGVVYVGSDDKNLYAINAVTGKEKWRFATGKVVFSSPAVVNGVVYVGSFDKNLYAIDAVTGKEKWRFATKDEMRSSPVVANGVVYIGSDDFRLYAIDAVTGTEKWRFMTGRPVSSSPAVAGGVIYFGSWNMIVYAIGEKEVIHQLARITELQGKLHKLLAETEQLVHVPASINTNLQTQDEHILEQSIKELESLRANAKPVLAFTFENTSLIANRWHKIGVTISNTGNSPAFDVTLSFSDEIEVKRVKPITIPAGKSATVEIGILPKKDGTIPFEITLDYRDAIRTPFKETQEFWIDVAEKGTIISDGQSTTKPLTPQDLQIIRAYEFYSGYIRLKISVKNPTPLTINNVILELDVDSAILYLERHEPEEYPLENERIVLGTINPNNDRTVSLYLEPTICAKEGTDVQCHVRYKDAQGKPGSLDMEPLRIQVVCPIFETKEPVNIGSLKQLIETLPSRDSKIFSVPRNLDAPTQLKIFQSVIQLHDIRHISTLRRANNFESWYYGRTKVTQKDMVIKLGIAKDMDMVEITAFSYDPKDLTGLLAEINRHVTEEVSKRGNVQKIFNISIKDSVLTRTNLLNNCDMDGKCSGDVTIADSVVTGSNIG
jgi:outer membrane protein assembly factor BamB